MKQLESHGTVVMTAPVTVTEVPVTPSPEPEEVARTSIAVGNGQGWCRHSSLQPGVKNPIATARPILCTSASLYRAWQRYPADAGLASQVDPEAARRSIATIRSTAWGPVSLRRWRDLWALGGSVELPRLAFSSNKTMVSSLRLVGCDWAFCLRAFGERDTLAFGKASREERLLIGELLRLQGQTLQ